MKKSKSDPSIKVKSKKTSLKSKKKRKVGHQMEGTSKIVKNDPTPRKSRWEEAAKIDQDLKKTEASALPTKMEKENLRESPRIRSLLDNKKKMVEQLFVTVTGKTLDDIIPDYLRKRSSDELKKLCLTELEKMTNDEVLDIMSGTSHPLFKEQETQTDFKANSKSGVASVKESIKIEKDVEQSENIVPIQINARDAQNQTPPEVLDEVAEDLGISEGDADLLELEMRARAIRSLLKLKSNEEFNIDPNLLED